MAKVACSACGHENEVFFRFCLRCGSALDGASAPAKATEDAPAEAPAAAEETADRLVQDGSEAAPPEAGEADRDAAASSAEEAAAPDAADADEPTDAAPEAASAPSTDEGSTEEAASPAGDPDEAAPAAPAEAAAPTPGAAPADDDIGSVTADLGPQLQAAAASSEENLDIAVAPAPAPEPAPKRDVSTRDVPVAPAGDGDYQKPRLFSAEVHDARADANYLEGVDDAAIADAWGHLVLVRPDGSDGASYPLVGERVRVGKEGADLSFPEDAFLAPHEFTLVREGGQVRLVPVPETVNGSFLRVQGPVELRSGSQLRVGQELLEITLWQDEEPSASDEEGTAHMGGYAPPDLWGRLHQVYAAGAAARIFLLVGDSVLLGREEGRISFPYDGYVSGRHARLSWNGRQCVLEDVGSSNGTFIRLTEEVVLSDGDRFLAGQHLFKYKA